MLLTRCSAVRCPAESRPIAVGVNDAELATDFREILNDAIKAKT